MGKPRFWMLSIATALGLAVTLSLGWWQLQRAGQKIALQSEIDQRVSMAPVPLETLLPATDAAAMHRPVSLRGRWLPQHTVFLDNRQMQGRPGFYVVTPFRLEVAQAVVLVQRGWVARNFADRQKLPAVDTPSEIVDIQGRLAPPPGKLYEFEGADSGPIRQNLDLARFRAETGLALAEVSVQQTGAPSQGLMRDWPEVASGAAKNYGYAFQWWALSALIAILYVWFQFISPRRKGKHA